MEFPYNSSNQLMSQFSALTLAYRANVGSLDGRARLVRRAAATMKVKRASTTIDWLTTVLHTAFISLGAYS